MLWIKNLTCILGLEEGIMNMEEIVLKVNIRKMGIDWRLVYNELKRLINMMKREVRERGNYKLVVS